MIVTCPNCSTHYELTKAEIKQANHRVQCGYCLNEWQITKQKTSSFFLKRKPLKKKHKKNFLKNFFPHKTLSRKTLIAVYSLYVCSGLLFLLGLLLILGGYLFRYEIVEAFPAGSRFYKGLKIPLYKTGLKLMDLKITPVFKKTDLKTVLVEGKIINQSRHRVRSPDLSIKISQILKFQPTGKLKSSVLNTAYIKKQTYLQTITSLKKENLKAGEKIRFSYKLRAPYDENGEPQKKILVDLSSNLLKKSLSQSEEPFSSMKKTAPVLKNLENKPPKNLQALEGIVTLMKPADQQGTFRP